MTPKPDPRREPKPAAKLMHVSTPIFDHRAPGNVLNEKILVTARGEPTPGGAYRHYSVVTNSESMESEVTSLQFHVGDPREGITGLSNEALLAVLIDRLRGFQFERNHDGTYGPLPGRMACHENGHALQHLEEALFWLKKRTELRLARRIEGQVVP